MNEDTQQKRTTRSSKRGWLPPVFRHTMTKHKSTHGGAREGAGRKPKDPEAPRIMWSGRLHPRTLAALKRYATAARSQGEIIDEAVRSWAARRRKS